MSDIYLVDDHALMRDSLKAVLEDAGHRVVGETAEPAQALADLQVLAPSLLLLDLNLGVHSGLALLEALQLLDLRVRTVVLTMSAQPRDITEAHRLGALGYVLKGSTARELLAAVTAVLQGRMHMAPELAALAAGHASAAAGRREELSAREREVLQRVVRGLSSSTIGEQLGLSPKTVDSYRGRLMTKLGVTDVPALVRLAVREGWIGLSDP